jgi:crossover junction endodeoxyribonuclease RuvC
VVVLGVDPGCVVAGFCVIEKKHNQKLSLLHAGALNLSSKKPLSTRVHMFYTFMKSCIEKYKCSVLALETPFLGKNAQSFLKLGYLRGVLYLLAEEYSLRICEFSPPQVKQAITGYGRAPKEQLARVVMRFFPRFSMPEKLDITDAMAVCMCACWRV